MGVVPRFANILTPFRSLPGQNNLPLPPQQIIQFRIPCLREHILAPRLTVKMDCTRQVDVPDEILVEIFSHLKNGFTAEVEALRQRRQCEKRRSSWQDLLSLEIGVARALHHTFHAVCLTSRQFRRTAQPLLYESVPMCTVRCWRDSNTLREYDGFEQQAQLLLRTLSENPDLRERVRTLRWDFFGWFEHKVHRNE